MRRFDRPLPLVHIIMTGARSMRRSRSGGAPLEYTVIRIAPGNITLLRRIWIFLELWTDDRPILIQLILVKFTIFPSCGYTDKPQNNGRLDR